jgi:hypothetical protein
LAFGDEVADCATIAYNKTFEAHGASQCFGQQIGVCA